MSENNAASGKAANPSLQKPTAIYMFLGYFLWPFCLIGLALEKDDDFIRFQCAQAFVLVVAQVIAMVVMYCSLLIIWLILPVFLVILAIAALIASYVFMIIAIVKTVKGEKYKIPLVGDIADSSVKKWFSK
jgi:uncharacterized membrane protein